MQRLGNNEGQQARSAGKSRHDQREQRHSLGQGERPLVRQRQSIQKKQRGHTHIYQRQKVVKQAHDVDVQGLHGIKLEGHEQQRHRKRSNKGGEQVHRDARRRGEGRVLIARKAPMPQKQRNGVIDQLDGEVLEQHHGIGFAQGVRQKIARGAAHNPGSTEK